MGKIVNLSFKVPEEIHKKLKVISALSGKSMSDIIINFIQKEKVPIPSFDEKPEKIKPKKTAKPKPGKAVKRKDENPNADESLIKAEILKHKAAGLSLQQISDQLQADGVETIRGGDWKKGTVDGLLRKWAAQGA